MIGPWQIVTGALRLEPASFEAIVSRPDGLRIAILLLLLGGFSNAIGQSVALFVNRVRPWRFVASLAVGALLFAGSVLIWGVAVAVLSSLAFSQASEARQVARVVGLAHAPRLFAFLVLTPYFGSLLGAILTVWTLLALVVGARTLFDLALIEASAVLGLAWLAIEIVSRTFGRPLVAATRWLRRIAAGTPLEGPLERAARRVRDARDEEA